MRVGSRWLSAALLGACATSAPPTGARMTRGAFDSRFEERDRATATPLPGAQTSTGDGVAIKTTGRGESARAAALAMVQALLEGDAPGLQQLFAEQVVFGLEGSGRPRAELVERCIEETRALAYEPNLSADRVVDVNAIEVRPPDPCRA